MGDLCKDIITFLATGNAVTGFGVDAFVDGFPDDPDDCVNVQEIAGNPYQRHSESTNRMVTITARSKGTASAKGKIYEITNLLDTSQADEQKLALTQDRWAVIGIRNAPFKRGVDSHNRVTYVLNLNVTTTRD